MLPGDIQVMGSFIGLHNATSRMFVAILRKPDLRANTKLLRWNSAAKRSPIAASAAWPSLHPLSLWTGWVIQ